LRLCHEANPEPTGVDVELPLETAMPFPRLILTCLLLFLGFAALAAPVPDDARRYMMRGMEAVEMARTPADFAAALEEYSRAAELAPDWADPYYNLGMIQNRLERYAEAVRNLRRYLELAPGAPDAAEVQNLLVRMEYRQERAEKARMDVTNLVGLWEPDADNGGAFYRFQLTQSQGRVLGGLRAYAFTEQRGLSAPPVMVPVQWDGTTLVIAHTRYFYCDRSVRSDCCPVDATLTLKLTAPDTLEGSLYTAAYRDRSAPAPEMTQKRVWKRQR
jgi:tetratricopeptide (TPR) repeat protein